LEVVRLGACGSQVHDAHAGTGDALGGPGQRVEAGDHGGASIRAGGPAASRDEHADGEDRERAHMGHRSRSLRTGIIINVVTTWTDIALSRLRDASGRSGAARRLVVEL